MKENIFAYLREYRSDIPSGLVVFLVALPLCLGIALASGAPLFSGIITGIIGGLVVGLLSGSHTSVSGPAAGLAVIVLSAISELGTFELFLTAVVLAGVIQLALGYMKAGIIGLYFPSSVIKGMLAAIGLILILKQIPYFFGVGEYAFGEMQYQEPDGGNTFSALWHALSQIHPGASLAGILSLSVLILWSQPFFKKLRIAKVVPGALLAVVLGVVVNLIFQQFIPAWVIDGKQLVSIPNISDPEVAATAFAFPDFSGLTDPVVWRIAAVVALIASLETLLSVEAVDKMDPHKRHTPNNRELKAQGVGNILAGLAGGLPMTAVIVRSTANISSGSRTKMSAFYHGVLLLICVVAIPFILNLIPLASLAAVLLVVGYKLSKPALYREQFGMGWNQFLPFIVTIVAILFTDLLVGIIIGMTIGVFFILRANYKTPYFYQSDEHPENGRKKITITLSEHVSFLNKASLQLTLDHLPANSKVVIDGSLCREIDLDALSIIKDFSVAARERNIDLSLKDMPSHIVDSHHAADHHAVTRKEEEVPAFSEAGEYRNN